VLAALPVSRGTAYGQQWHRLLSWLKDRLSDAGGLGSEFQAGPLPASSIPSLRKDEHPAVKGLRRAGHSIRSEKTPPGQ